MSSNNVQIADEHDEDDDGHIGSHFFFCSFVRSLFFFVRRLMLLLGNYGFFPVVDN